MLVVEGEVGCSKGSSVLTLGDVRGRRLRVQNDYILKHWPTRDVSREVLVRLVMKDFGARIAYQSLPK